MNFQGTVMPNFWGTLMPGRQTVNATRAALKISSRGSEGGAEPTSSWGNGGGHISDISSGFGKQGWVCRQMGGQSILGDTWSPVPVEETCLLYKREGRRLGDPGPVFRFKQREKERDGWRGQEELDQSMHSSFICNCPKGGAQVPPPQQGSGSEHHGGSTHTV